MFYQRVERRPGVGQLVFEGGDGAGLRLLRVARGFGELGALSEASLFRLGVDRGLRGPVGGALRFTRLFDEVLGSFERFSGLLVEIEDLRPGGVVEVF